MVFLLIASFGILFAGCSSGIRGPSAEDMNDITFTQDDVSKFREMTTSSSSVGVDGGPGLVPPVVLSANSGSAVATVVENEIDLDRSEAPIYKALRMAPATAPDNQYVIANNIANLREGPSSASRLLKTLNNGDPVTVTGWENGEWARVDSAGVKGFITIRYIAKPVTKEDLPAKEKFFENQYYVSFAFVNVRAEPNQGSEKLGEIPGKQLVAVKGIQNGWAALDFQGKTGYVSVDYLTKFSPRFIVRQGTYSIPVLRYTITDDAALQLMVSHLQTLKNRGVRLVSFKTFRQMLLDQDRNGTAIEGKMVLVGVTGITPQNARMVSDALTSNSLAATLFIQTKDVGISGITQKMLLTIVANGLDVQSGGHSGNDLRALTNAQVKLEIEQSRKMLEDMTGKPVFAMSYPLGGANDRVTELAADAAFLFGVGNAAWRPFTRADLLNLPIIAVSGAMTAEDLAKFIP